MTTRRTFLKTSSMAAVAAVGRSALGGHYRSSHVYYPPGTLPRATDPDLKALSLQALDAAKAEGAQYADVRFTITRWRTFEGNQPTDREALAVGVRALAKGTWGFAAYSDWAPARIAELGRKAARNARVMAWPQVPPIELIDRPPAATGHWVTPVKRDPFTVPADEVVDWIQQLYQAAAQQKAKLDAVFLTFQRQDRTFASTEGTYVTQTVYTSLGGVPHEDIPGSMIVLQAADPSGKQKAIYSLPFITPTGAGYEVLSDAKAVERMPEWVEKTQELAAAKKIEGIGEYDVVFDGAAMAAIVNGTFGAAVEYDRAVGYEANEAGTSYLAPPLTLLGTGHAPSSVTITADRTLPQGTATVQWDDEGVPVHPFPVIKNGTLVNYAISREFVAELKPWYQRHGVPVHSNGCSASESAFVIPMVYPPNLRLEPDARDTSLQALVAGVDRGFLVCGGDVEMDHQQLSGRGTGAQVYVIKHGQLAGQVKAAYRLQSQTFWKNLVALGGTSTAMLSGFVTSKGQPNQIAMHSVRGVAARCQKVYMSPASLA